MNATAAPSGTTMNGYPRIAKLMGGDSEFAIFRRFSVLNAHNLLYLQAELVFLEAELHTIAEADDRASNRESRRDFASDWWALSHPEVPEDREQWDKVLEIRAKLKEYS